MQRLEKFRQAYPQIPWRGQLQILGLILLIVVLLALVSGFYLNVSARSAGVGRDIQGMQNQIRVIEQENEYLKSILAELTSSRSLEQRTNDSGFVSIQQDEVLYVFVPGYTGRPAVSLAPTSEKPVVRAPILPDAYTESLIDWIYKQISPYVAPLLEVEK